MWKPGVNGIAEGGEERVLIGGEGARRRIKKMNRAENSRYLWEAGDTADAEAGAVVEAIDVEGSRTSLSTADVRSAMPGLRHQEGSGQARGGNSRNGERW